MKIAFAAAGPSSHADISAHAARAPYYLLYTEDGSFVASLANPGAQVVRGAAPVAAQFLFDHGVDTLVAGDFGPKFISELSTHGIGAMQYSGSIPAVLSKIVDQAKR